MLIHHSKAISACGWCEYFRMRYCVLTPPPAPAIGYEEGAGTLETVWSEEGYGVVEDLKASTETTNQEWVTYKLTARPQYRTPSPPSLALSWRIRWKAEEQLHAVHRQHVLLHQRRAGVRAVLHVRRGEEDYNGAGQTQEDAVRILLRGVSSSCACAVDRANYEARTVKLTCDNPAEYGASVPLTDGFIGAIVSLT